MDWVCSFNWVTPVFLLVPGRWANHGQTPQAPPLHSEDSRGLWDTYHILRGGEIPGVMWERAGLGMQLGCRTPYWLISSCSWGLGIALQRESLALANLPVSSNCVLSLVILQVAPALCLATCSLSDFGKVAGRPANNREEWDMPFQGHPVQLCCPWSYVQMLLGLSKMTVSLASWSQWELGSQCQITGTYNKKVKCWSQINGRTQWP